MDCGLCGTFCALSESLLAAEYSEKDQNRAKRSRKKDTKTKQLLLDFGFPLLGSGKDNFDAQTVQAEHPALFDEYKIPDQRFFFWTYDSIRAVEVLEHPMLGEAARTGLQEQIGHSGRKTLKVAAVLPLIMAVSFAAILLWFKARGGYRSLQIRED